MKNLVLMLEAPLFFFSDHLGRHSVLRHRFLCVWLASIYFVALSLAVDFACESDHHDSANKSCANECRCQECASVSTAREELEKTQLALEQGESDEETDA
jgi:hypothetical protein